ncbi:uncharacterized protein LOC119166975 isoform X2 [Rhipicephalus microplus]|uniref:uncharacterized protein LOC119166975 isoform X2 n=1 Tax=Rhipicephalus microplus TaxID=6941 RepID=UPI003F6BD64B
MKSDSASDRDPWNDLGAHSGGEIKMSFEDDFHLTVIPNFHHDSDAYISKLEHRLERLQLVNQNPNTKEIVAAITRARALRMKYAETNPDANAKPQDESAEDEDGGFLALFPTLIMPISRRFFPRLALTKEEAQNLLKYDYLLLHHHNETNDNAAAPAEVDDYEVRDANTVPDTSWEQQQKDSSIENPFVGFETPEANEFDIPKNWFNDHHSAVIGEVHHSTANTPDDTANNARGATNRSALSLSANINAIQEASTVTSFAPTRRSNDAFYHFAFIRTSLTSTQESAKAETLTDYNSGLGNAEYIRWNSTSIRTPCGLNPFASACSIDVPDKQHTSFVVECKVAEGKGLSKSSTNATEGDARDQVVLVAISTPSLNAPKDTEGNNLPKVEEEDKKQFKAIVNDEQLQAIDEHNSRSQNSILRAACVDDTDKVSEVTHEDGLVSTKDVQSTIFPEVTAPSFTTKESIDQIQCVFEEGFQRVSVEKGCKSHVSEPPVREATVTSSSTRDSFGAGVEVPWLFDKESDTTLGGEDVLQQMSSLVRASVDEDDDTTRADGIQASQMSAVCTQMSSTCGYSERTHTKASEGTSGNITTNYSDPHSNLFDEESLIKREESQAPIIRMYGPFPHDIHTSFQEKLLSWGLPRGAESPYNPCEATSPKLSLPTINSHAVKRHDNSLLLATKESNSTESSQQQAARIVNRPHSDSSRPSFGARHPKDAKCRTAPSTKSQQSKDCSFASSASSVQTTSGPRIEERPMRLSSSKLSTCSMFKSRQRSVHWFKTIEDVDSETVVRDCDYLVTSEVKMEVPKENKKKTLAPKAMSRTSQKPSESDVNEESTVHEGSKKFAKGVLEDSVTVAGKVDSFLEASCSNEKGASRGPEEAIASNKYEDALACEGAVPVESLEGHNESARDLVTAKDAPAANSGKEKTIVDTLELQEAIEFRSEAAISSTAVQDSREVIVDERTNAFANADTESLEVLSMTASSLKSENGDSITTVECGGRNVYATNGSALLESPSSKALQCKFPGSLVKTWEHLDNVVDSERPCSADKAAVLSSAGAEAQTKPMSCEKFADVLESTGEKVATNLTLERESGSIKATSCTTPVSTKCADTRAILLRYHADLRDVEKQEQTNVPTGGEKFVQECEMQANENAANVGICSAQSQDATGSRTLSNSDDKQPAAPEDDKKKTIEGRDKENEDSSANRDSTVLQCHELTCSSRFSTFSTSNKGAAPVQRSFNMTRTLRVTTTNQFKPLNMRHSIMGIRGSDSDLLGRPLSVQSREVVLPRNLKRFEKGKKPSTHYRERDSTCNSSSKKSLSCNTSNSNNTETLASEVTARGSHSVTEAHVRACLGTSAVRSRTQTIGQNSSTALGDTVIESHANEAPLNTQENEGSKKCKSKGDKKSKIKLPFKKRACCRMSENWSHQKKDPVEGSLPVERKTKDPNAVAKDANGNIVEGERNQSSIVFQEVPTTRAALKRNVLQESEDMDFAHLEYASDSAPEERTISLVPESQYSTIGGTDVNQTTPISATLGGDTNVEGVKLHRSLPSEGECTATSFISKDDPPSNDVPTSAALDQTSVTEGEKSVSISFERLTMPVCKPVLTKGCRNKGGEKDVDTEVDNSRTSALSITLEADAVEESTSSIRCDVENDHGDNGQPGGAYRL